MLRRKSNILMAVLFAAAAFMSGCSDDDDNGGNGGNGAGNDNNGETITQVIQTDEDLSIFEEAVERAGLTDQLHNQGQYTVFAPTNEAFRNKFQSEEQLEAFMNDSAALRELILYHITYGRRDANSLNSMASPSSVVGTLLEDSEIVVIKQQVGDVDDDEEPAEEVRLNYDTRAEIVESDINARNGIVHKIDKVLNIRRTNNG